MYYNDSEEEEPQIDTTKYREPSRIILTKAFKDGEKKLTEVYCKNWCYFGTCKVDINPTTLSYKGRYCKYASLYQSSQFSVCLDAKMDLLASGVISDT